MRIRVQTIKPVKPIKKFIITLVKVPQSVQVTEECIASAKIHGEHRNLEIMPAIDKFEVGDFLARHGITFYYNHKFDSELLDITATAGCFASHYKLWNRCVALGEPIIILEHDALFRSPIPPFKIQACDYID